MTENDQAEERELRKIERRAKKKAVHLKRKGNLHGQADAAWRRAAACAARVRRIGGRHNQGKASAAELLDACKALNDAIDDQLAVWWAMSDEQVLQDVEKIAEHRKQKKRAGLDSI